MSDAQANEHPAMNRLPFGFAKRFGVILDTQLDDQGHAGLVYKAPLAPSVFSEVQRFTGRLGTLREVSSVQFDGLLSSAYEEDSDEAMQFIEDLGESMDLSSLMDQLPESGDLLEQDDDAPIIRLINSLLTEAIKVGASDIHIETYESRLVVRFRVDGVLREIVSPRRAMAPLLVSRIKVMAKLDIAEKRLPQDGRISVRVGGKEVDVRGVDHSRE